jgi:hypothetical protein
VKDSTGNIVEGAAITGGASTSAPHEPYPGASPEQVGFTPAGATTNLNGTGTIYVFATRDLTRVGAELRSNTFSRGDHVSDVEALSDTAVSLTLPFAKVPSAGTVNGVVEIEVPPGAVLSAVGAEAASEAGLPNGSVAVVGALGYEVSGLEPGSSLNVKLYLPPGSEPTKLYKYFEGQYFDVTSLGTFSGNSVTLHLTDGGAGDADFETNGTIVDPVVPVRVVASGAAPTMSKLSPSKGPPAGGTRVTITGTNFVAGATTIKFGTARASQVSVTSPTSLTAIAPPNSAGAANVSVITPGGTSTAIPKGQFKYSAPTVTGVSPSSGSANGGNQVTVTGTGFAPGTGTVMLFGKVSATNVSCSSTTTCTVTAPAAIKVATVDVIAVVGKKSKKGTADHYTYH